MFPGMNDSRCEEIRNFIERPYLERHHEVSLWETWWQAKRRLCCIELVNHLNLSESILNPPS